MFLKIFEDKNIDFEILKLLLNGRLGFSIAGTILDTKLLLKGFYIQLILRFLIYDFF